MLKDRIIVADGDSGWDVRLYEFPGYQGEYVTLASGLDEEDSDNYVTEFCDKIERRANR